MDEKQKHDEKRLPATSHSPELRTPPHGAQTVHRARRVRLLDAVHGSMASMRLTQWAMARGGLEPPTPRFSGVPRYIPKPAHLQGFCACQHLADTVFFRRFTGGFGPRMGVVVQKLRGPFYPPAGRRRDSSLGSATEGISSEARYERRVVGEAFLAPPVFVAAVLDGELCGGEEVIETVAAPPARPFPAQLLASWRVDRAEGVAKAVGLESSDKR